MGIELELAAKKNILVKVPLVGLKELDHFVVQADHILLHGSHLLQHQCGLILGFLITSLDHQAHLLTFSSSGATIALHSKRHLAAMLLSDALPPQELNLVPMVRMAKVT